MLTLYLNYFIMKAYYLIVSLLATIGISLLIPDYPVLIGIIGFGIAIGYRNEVEHYNKENGDKR